MATDGIPTATLYHLPTLFVGHPGLAAKVPESMRGCEDWQT